MANNDEYDWITIKGTHIKIRKDLKDKERSMAINKAIAEKNENLKTRQIEENRKQAQQLNANNQSQLPRRKRLKDISAENANRTTDVLHLRTKQRYRFKDDTNITNVLVFAGKGCNKEFRDAKKYAKRWGGKPEDWQHCSGDAMITDGTRTLAREVHWVQGADGKMREAFIKEYGGNSLSRINKKHKQ